MISIGHWYAQMISWCLGLELHGHDVELDAVLEGCTLLPVNDSVCWEAIALDGLLSKWLLLYIPLNGPVILC